MQLIDLQSPASSKPLNSLGILTDPKAKIPQVLFVYDKGISILCAMDRTNSIGLSLSKVESCPCVQAFIQVHPDKDTKVHALQAPGGRKQDKLFFII